MRKELSVDTRVERRLFNAVENFLRLLVRQIGRSDHREFSGSI